MKYSIRGEKLEITPPIKNYIIEKLSKMDKVIDNNVEAKIILSVKNKINKVEVTS